MSTTPPSPPSAAKWAAMVEKIQQEDPAGMEELYSIFSRGIRFLMCRTLGGEDLDDKVHDTFLVVVQAIRRGELREPDRLMGFVRTVVRRQVATHIGRAVRNRRELADLDSTPLVAEERNPEEVAMASEREELMTRVLREISEKDREILTRFYLREQTQETICEEMGINETQFRLLKSRAKQRFGALGQKKLKAVAGFFMRASAGSGH